MSVYYNEFVPYRALWIHRLMKAGALPAGRVDCRDLRNVYTKDLQNAHQAHFFAGIGGWAKALELAKWPRERAVWTGSCPCQPFSLAGKLEQEKDKRHLWPDWFVLIKLAKPATIFGEQVASPAGRKWFSGVRADLETLGYAVGCADLCAAGVGAKHQRQRLFYVAHARSANVPRFKYERKSLRCQQKEASTIGCDRSVFARIQNVPDSISAREFDGIRRPVDIVSAFGDAIVPQVGALFIKAFLEAEKDLADHVQDHAT